MPYFYFGPREKKKQNCIQRCQALFMYETGYKLQTNVGLKENVFFCSLKESILLFYNRMKNREKRRGIKKKYYISLFLPITFLTLYNLLACSSTVSSLWKVCPTSIINQATQRS